MMGRAHALSGYAVGMAFTEAIFMAPWDVRVMSVGIIAGGALLPDLDQPSSTASRSLGWLTVWIAKGVAYASLSIYHATRLPGDSPSKENPHRLITHVPVGAVTFGILAAVICLVSPYAGAVIVGLMVALGVRAVPTLRHAAQDHLPAGGVGLFLLGTVLGWWELTHHFAWWWVVPVSITLGCLVHREGDWCTKGGVPRRLWPLPEEDERWRFHHSPKPWTAGDVTEVTWVTPGYGLAALLGASWVSGLDSLLITAWMSRNG